MDVYNEIRKKHLKKIDEKQDNDREIKLACPYCGSTKLYGGEWPDDSAREIVLECRDCKKNFGHSKADYA